MIEVTLNQEDHSYMFDDDDESTTPVKACTESGYHHVTAGCSSVKRRRRMLQFEDQQPMETTLFTSESFSSILRSSVSIQNLSCILYHKKLHEVLILSLMLPLMVNLQAREETYDELLPEGSQLIEDASASSFEGLDGLHADEWYVDCLNDPEAPTLPDDLYCFNLFFFHFSIILFAFI